MEKIKNHEILFTLILFLVLYFGHNGQRHYWSISLKVYDAMSKIPPYITKRWGSVSRLTPS